MFGVESTSSDESSDETEGLFERYNSFSLTSKEASILTQLRDEGGELLSWGYNYFAQCGQENITPTEIPSVVPFKSEDGNSLDSSFTKRDSIFTKNNIVSISCGESHSGCLTKDNKMYFWGSNRFGQCCTGNYNLVTSPTRVECESLRGKKINKIVCGSQQTLILTGLGELYVCGNGGQGRLGLGDGKAHNTPIFVSLLSGAKITNVATGLMHCIALSDRGRLFSWGLNKFGQLGLGDDQDRKLPCVVENKDSEGLEWGKILGISCGRTFTMMLTDDGFVYGCGDNMVGQIGDGTTTDTCHFQKVSLPIHALAQQISCGNYHTLCLTSVGVYTWGFSSDGALATGEVPFCQNIPKLVNIFSLPDNSSSSQNNSIVERIVQVSAGGWHSMFLTNKGRLLSCGYGDSFRLGDGINRDEQWKLVEVKILGKVLSVDCGGAHSVAIVDAKKPPP